MANATKLWFAALMVALGILPPLSIGQAPPKSESVNSAASAERGIKLAAAGQCREALPLLKKNMRLIADKDLKYQAAMATARCAMSVDQREVAADALFLLSKEFPKDPQVLYLATHYYSELASRASRELAATAPHSYQAHQLQAEAMESQGKWEEAAGEYQSILERNPQVPGIHYRLGRLYLSLPDSAENTTKAKAEFEQELQIDPKNAASEFLLGEISRRAGEYGPAIQHFSVASKIDPSFAEAFLALGMSLNSAERFPDAISPLEAYIKMLPDDPAGHYQLSIAYSRTGRKPEALREMEIQQALSRKNPPGTLPDR
jgi:tetratricopeptide (TPR) repeat protein